MTHRLELSMLIVFASFGMKLAQEWERQRMSGKGIFDPVLNMNSE